MLDARLSCESRHLIIAPIGYYRVSETGIRSTITDGTTTLRKG